MFYIIMNQIFFPQTWIFSLHHFIMGKKYDLQENQNFFPNEDEFVYSPSRKSNFFLKKEIDSANTNRRISSQGKEYDFALRKSYFFP